MMELPKAYAFPKKKDLRKGRPIVPYVLYLLSIQYCTVRTSTLCNCVLKRGLYRIHNYSTLVGRADIVARKIKFCVRLCHLGRLSLSSHRFYKALSCCKSPFVRGARPNGQSNGSYRVRVHVARATESHNVSHVYRW